MLRVVLFMLLSVCLLAYTALSFVHIPSAPPPVFTQGKCNNTAFSNALLIMVPSNSLVDAQNRFRHAPSTTFKFWVVHDRKNVKLSINICEGMIIETNEEEVYPPRRHEMKAMKTISSLLHDMNIYSVTRVDPDVYLDNAYFDFIRDKQLDGVIGYPAKGRKGEIGKLGFPPNTEFCMGGLGVTYSASMLTRISSHKWDRCIKRPASHHSDTEAQRCILKNTGRFCLDNVRSDMRRLIKQKLVQVYYLGYYTKLTSDSRVNQAWVVHAIKDDKHFLPFSKSKERQLTPVLTAQDMRGVLHRSLTSVCVHNQFAQSQETACSNKFPGDDCSIVLKQCKYTHNPQFKISHAYVLTMDTKLSKMLFGRVSAWLDRYNITPHAHVASREEGEKYVYRALSRITGKSTEQAEFMLRTRQHIAPDQKAYIPLKGELMLKYSYIEMLRRAVGNGQRVFFVFEDDAVLHVDFASRINHAMRSSTGCLNPLEVNDGIVLLGSSEWNMRWDHIYKNMKGRACYDLHDRALGAFGAVLTRNAAIRLIELFDIFPRKPFDLLFYELAKEGYYTKVMFPNLAIADHSHKSRVNPSRVVSNEMEKRASKHMWDLTKYYFNRPP